MSRLNWSKKMRAVMANDEPIRRDVLQALAPFVLLSGPAMLASLTVNYLGAARQRVPIAIAALGANAVWDLIFLSKMGIVAGAWGTELPTS